MFIIFLMGIFVKKKIILNPCIFIFHAFPDGLLEQHFFFLHRITHFWKENIESMCLLLLRCSIYIFVTIDRTAMILEAARKNMELEQSVLQTDRQKAINRDWSWKYIVRDDRENVRNNSLGV